MKDFDMLRYHIDSSRHFLKYNKHISSSHKEQNIVFYKHLHQLVIAKEKNDTEKLSSLKDVINKDMTAINKEWFEEKIMEK